MTIDARDRLIPFLDLDALHAPLRPQLDEVWSGVANTHHFIGGAAVERFDQEWATYCGAASAVGVANGTDAIELALRALGIGVGDEVIVPANTFIATFGAVAATGATPVPVDVDPETLLLTAAHVTAALTSSTAAVVPVHLYGQPCNMAAIAAVSERAGVAVISDAAQAHGASWGDQPIASWSTVTTYSFYPGKNLGAFGDGGAVVTDDQALAAKVRSLANHGRADGEHVRHQLLGRNSRLDNLQAGILSVKLPHLDNWNARRRARRDQFVRRLDRSGIVPISEASGATSVWHLNVVQVDDRDRAIAQLARRGIEARVHYPQPCHRHPAFADPPRLPVVEAAADRIMSLPMSPTMTVEEVDAVCDAMLAIVAETVPESQ